MFRQAFVKWGLSFLLPLALASGVAAKPAAPPEGPSVALAALPGEAQLTYRRVLEGGPFPHAKDGTVFGNRERMLPPKARGYYREYTVQTPGARNRGARRLVCGGQEPKRPEACWYTADHYSSFSRIVP